MRLARIRVKNFRCLKDVTIFPSETTVLIGENNAGKSALLEALNAVLGQLRSARFEPQDLYTDKRDLPPESRDSIEIELEFLPSQGDTFTKEEHEAFYKQFDIDDKGKERICIAAKYGYNQIEEEFAYEACFMKKDGPGERFSPKYMKLLPFYLIHALRDLSREMTLRAGFWMKLLETIKLSDASRQRIEALLADANAELLQHGTLQRIRDQFKDLLGSFLNIGKSADAVLLSPLPLEPSQLVHQSEVYVKAPGSEVHFPITSFGMGSQSVSVLALFRIYVDLLGLQRSLLGVEEPEAHLHPHLQRFVFEELRKLPNQVLVTTHSTFITDVAGLHDIVVLRRQGPRAVARQIPKITPTGQPFLTAREERVIRGLITAENSEMFFAKAVLMVEGKSEKLALPVFARAMGINFDQLGISLLPIGGKHFGPYLKILSEQALDIPWVVLCDGDAARTLGNALASLGIVAQKQLKDALGTNRLVQDILEPKRCFTLSAPPERLAFESFLLCAGFQAEYERAIEWLDGATALDDYVAQQNARLKGQGKKPDYDQKPKAEQILDFINNAKPRYAEVVAQLITDSGTSDRRIPEAFKKPIEVIRNTATAALSGARSGYP